MAMVFWPRKMSVLLMLPGETDGFSSESKARGSNESGGLAFMSVRFEVDRYLNDNYSQLKVKP